jgi:hypothetical protein
MTDTTFVFGFKPFSKLCPERFPDSLSYYITDTGIIGFLIWSFASFCFAISNKAAGYSKGIRRI